MVSGRILEKSKINASEHTGAHLNFVEKPITHAYLLSKAFSRLCSSRVNRNLLHTECRMGTIKCAGNRHSVLVSKDS